MSQADHRINLEENSKYRVAWDMAKAIAHTETGVTKDREYFLTLTRQCYDTIYGYRPMEDVLGREKSHSTMGLRY